MFCFVSFFWNKNTQDDWKLHLKDFKINFKTDKNYLGVNICISQRLSLYERVPWRFPLNGVLPWCFLNDIYRPLTTRKKEGREKLPKYENLSLISQNWEEAPWEMEFSLPEVNFHNEFWNKSLMARFLLWMQTELIF